MASWEDLPDVKPAPKGASWEDLPDMPDLRVGLGDPGSPLAKAAAEQSGELIRVPDGEGGELWFDRKGRRVLHGDEVRAQTERQAQPLKELMLRKTIAALDGASNSMTSKVGGIKAAMTDQPTILDAAQTVLNGGNPLRRALAAYDKGQHDTRQVVDAANAENPGSNIAGALLMPAPGPGKAVKGAGFLKRALALAAGPGTTAALNAFGRTTETQSAGDAALETVTSGLIGGGLGAGLGAVAQKGGALRETLRTKKAAKELVDFETKARQARSSAGGQGVKISETWKRANDVLDNPNASQATALAAQRIVDDPRMQDAAERALVNRFQNTTNDLNEFDALREIASEAGRDIPGKAAKSTDDYFTKSALAEDIMPKVKSLLLRGALGAGAGALVGGDNNRAAGAVGGAGLVMGLTSPGTVQAARNLASSPRIQDRLAQGAGPIADLLNKAQSRVGAPAAAKALSPAEKERIDALLEALRSKVVADEGATP